MIKSTLLLALTSALVAAGGSWWATNTYWQNKWAERDKQELQATLELTKAMRQREQISAANMAEIDKTQYEELQHAHVEIQTLRADVAAGRRRLQQCQTGQRTAPNPAGTTARMGDQPAAEQAAGTAGAEPNILNLGEHALTAIAQRDACVTAYNQARELLAE